MVIDGKVGYTGGVNIADEYMNEVVKFGHWKDTAIRLEGEAVWELPKLFLVDFGINMRRLPITREDLYPDHPGLFEQGYVIPFGDGPHPIYERRVGKSVIQNMLSGATRYAWMYKCDAAKWLKMDMEDTLKKCIEVTQDMLKTNLLQRFICAVVRIFAPML